MITNSPPVAGSVLRYAYLWKREADAGRDEARKERPVALLLATRPEDGECVVLPISHAVPEDPDLAVEIPPRERERLGLDDAPAWIVLSEVNTFFWPGPDLRPVPGVTGSVVYGVLTRGLYAQVLSRVKALLRARRVGQVPRT